MDTWSVGCWGGSSLCKAHSEMSVSCVRLTVAMLEPITWVVFEHPNVDLLALCCGSWLRVTWVWDTLWREKTTCLWAGSGWERRSVFLEQRVRHDSSCFSLRQRGSTAIAYADSFLETLNMGINIYMSMRLVCRLDFYLHLCSCLHKD